MTPLPDANRMVKASSESGTLTAIPDTGRFLVTSLAPSRPWLWLLLLPPLLVVRAWELDSLPVRRSEPRLFGNSRLVELPFGSGSR